MKYQRHYDRQAASQLSTCQTPNGNKLGNKESYMQGIINNQKEANISSSSNLHGCFHRHTLKNITDNVLMCIK